MENLPCASDYRACIRNSRHSPTVPALRSILYKATQITCQGTTERRWGCGSSCLTGPLRKLPSVFISRTARPHLGTREVKKPKESLETFRFCTVISCGAGWARNRKRNG